MRCLRELTATRALVPRDRAAPDLVPTAPPVGREALSRLRKRLQHNPHWHMAGCGDWSCNTGCDLRPIKTPHGVYVIPSAKNGILTNVL